MKWLFAIASILIFGIGFLTGRRQSEIKTVMIHTRDTVRVQLPAPPPDPPKVVYHKVRDTVRVAVNDSVEEDVTAWTFNHETSRDGDSIYQEITFFGPPLERLNVFNRWNGNSMYVVTDSSVVTKTIIERKRLGWGIQLGVGVNQNGNPTISATVGLNWRP
jgi:hypothetical protein